jgi:hypothetical protein
VAGQRRVPGRVRRRGPRIASGHTHRDGLAVASLGEASPISLAEHRVSFGVCLMDVEHYRACLDGGVEVTQPVTVRRSTAVRFLADMPR